MSQQHNFIVKINCVVLSTQIDLNRKFILSTNPERIELPTITVDKEFLIDIEKNIVGFLKQYLFVNDLELLPQIINLHSTAIESEDNILNVIYGFIVGYTNNIDNDKCHWIEFDYLEPIPYSSLIFEVTQKLV